MDAIRLDNMAVFAHHGVAAEERTLGQRFYIDVELWIDLTVAASRDELEQSADYGKVYQVATETFAATEAALIEHAAWRIMLELFRQFPAEEITVRVRKPSAPIAGILQHVEVELTRHRNEVEGEL